MRTPIRSAPEEVVRWTSRARRLRWLDAVLAWLALWIVLALTVEAATTTSMAVLAAVMIALAAALPPLRVRWRPASAAVGLSVARALRPGDRAWYVRPERVESVIVTARHGLRVVIARPGETAEEGLEVRPTRVLLVPGP
jgi:hypothetical protein